MIENKKEIKKRLSMELALNLHCEIKRRSAQRNISIAQWIVHAINEQIKEEMKYE